MGAFHAARPYVIRNHWLCNHILVKTWELFTCIPVNCWININMEILRSRRHSNVVQWWPLSEMLGQFPRRGLLAHHGMKWVGGFNAWFSIPPRLENFHMRTNSTGVKSVRLNLVPNERPSSIVFSLDLNKIANEKWQWTAVKAKYADVHIVCHLILFVRMYGLTVSVGLLI